MMEISLDELFAHSFVISISNERLSAFKNRFHKEDLPMPMIFTGFQYKNGVYRSAGIVKTRDTSNVRLSNLAIVKVAEALDWPYVCIFEDDASPCIGAKQKLKSILQDLPEDIDMLKLGWLCKKDVINFNQKLCHAYTFGSHAYVVFKCCYETFQKNATKFFITDTFPMNDPACHIYCTNDMLFVQDDREFKTKSVHINVRTLFFPQLSADGQLKDFNL